MDTTSIALLLKLILKLNDSLDKTFPRRPLPITRNLILYQSIGSYIANKRFYMFFHKMNKAMRYYRFWIYSCNMALLFGTLVYLFAFICVLKDKKMLLFSSIKLYDPTFLYSYCAIIIQGGVLQTIGCLGAIRLNEKFLNLYLVLMIALLFGDGIVGIVWILRFNTIAANLRGDLKTKLHDGYVLDKEFQELWDSVQIEYQCCGVDGPYDYNMTAMIEKQYKILVYRQKFPESCCRVNTISLPNQLLTNEHTCLTEYDPDLIYMYGCYDHIENWFQHSADLLSVLGFCVITFIKVCFLCILRYEIKEMIQKIKILKDMSNVPAVPINGLEAYLPRPSVQQDSTQTLLSNTAPQSTYRTGCTAEKHHHLHHHHIPSFAGGLGKTDSSKSDEVNPINCKKQSIV